MPSIAFVTTCKGRLHHLKVTLPLMAAQEPDELIVVDYGCPDGTGDWVEANYPQAKVVRVRGEPGFNLSKARNRGAEAATSEWLFFLDADLMLASNMAAELKALLAPGWFLTPLLKGAGDPWELHGSFCCRREDYVAAQGYDEVIEGWGYEDLDLYERFKLQGVQQGHFPHQLASSIPHDDSERDVSSKVTDRRENEAVNGCYSHAKRLISAHRGGTGNMPLETRRTLLDNVRRLVQPWYAAGATQPLALRFVVGKIPHRRLSWAAGISSETTITVLIRPLPGRTTRR